METFEAYLKEYQEVVEKLLHLNHVPRYIVLMELKDVIRRLSELIIETESHVNFLDKTHEKIAGKPY